VDLAYVFVPSAQGTLKNVGLVVGCGASDVTGELSTEAVLAQVHTASPKGAVANAPVVLGALERSSIDDVIKQHMGSYKSCYQSELGDNPTLSGKVMVKFVVAKDGSVTKAEIKSTTLQNAAVESCLRDHAMQMQFPQPQGGGIVIVSYPFVFSPG
jgi:hypothetical protein